MSCPVLPVSSSKDPKSIYAALEPMIKKAGLGKLKSKQAYELVAQYKRADSEEKKDLKIRFEKLFEYKKIQERGDDGLIENHPEWAEIVKEKVQDAIDSIERQDKHGKTK